MLQLLCSIFSMLNKQKYLSIYLILAQSAVPRPLLKTDNFNCLTKTAIQANLVIACIALSTDNSSHSVFFCLGTSLIENRLPVDVTSLAKFLSVLGPDV